jgi:hypothetical protein
MLEPGRSFTQLSIGGRKDGWKKARPDGRKLGRLIKEKKGWSG